MKKNLIKTLGLASSLLAAMPMGAFAASTLVDSVGSVSEDIVNETPVGQDTVQDQHSEYSDEITTDKTEEVEVYATQASTFSVIIPKTVVLGGEDGNGAYSVKVKGNISGNQTIAVTPAESVTLSEVSTSENKKADIIAEIAQTKTTWVCDEVTSDAYVSTNGTISTDDMSAGSWKGTFLFNVALNDVTAETVTE